MQLHMGADILGTRNHHYRDTSSAALHRKRLDMEIIYSQMEKSMWPREK